MLKNYLKTAIRSLLRHRFFSAINIFGLAVSMSICMAIIMLVADQMTNDRYNTKRDRIYRVNSIPTGRDGHQFNETGTTSLALREELLTNYSGVAQSVRIMRGFANSWIELDQNVNIPVSGYFVDPEMLDMFEYELELGDPKTALTEPYSVVLTKKAAKKLFPQENPVGQLLQVREKEVYKVTGVLKETTHKSHIVFEALASIATIKSQEAIAKTKESQLDKWYDYTDGWVYIEFAEGRTEGDIEKTLAQIEKKHFTVLPKPETMEKIHFHLQGLMSISPGPLINNPIGPFLPWLFIYFFAGIAGVVMLTSCFNFTNLSIARSLTRAKEIGIRKVTGALRRQIFAQFLAESVVIAFFSLILAFGLLFILKPLIMQLSFARIMRWGLEENYFVYGVFVLFAAIVGILAGLFPAVVLSGFQPIKVLKNLSNMKLFSKMGLRKALLVAQFTFSLIFILTVIVVYNQLGLYMKADHGFNMDKKMVVRLSSTSATLLKNELLTQSGITNVSAASHVPASGETRGGSYKRKLSDKEWTMVYYYSVDEDYLKSIDITLAAGKFYTADNVAANKNQIVLSELAAKEFGFASSEAAIGEQIITQHDSSARTIIGIVKDYNHQMLMEKSKPLALLYNPDDFAMVQVSYQGTYAETAKTVEVAWAKINPGLKIDHKDFSNEVHKMYTIFFGDIGAILSVISFLAIIISSLGLLGMATYSTETRRREISIRKILGSENGALIYLLSKGFVFILALSIVIAVPVAYALNSLWLNLLPYHVTMNLTVIGTGVLILLGFGVATIGSQTWRATFVNPVDHLRGE